MTLIYTTSCYPKTDKSNCQRNYINLLCFGFGHIATRKGLFGYLTGLTWLPLQLKFTDHYGIYKTNEDDVHVCVCGAALGLVSLSCRKREL